MRTSQQACSLIHQGWEVCSLRASCHLFQPASAQQSLSNTPAEGEPRIDGSPEVGQTLSADTTAIADADGLEEVVFQYQWLSEDADIPGATGSTYTLTSGDVGKAIRVRVSFTDDGDNEEMLTSAPAVVTAAGPQLQSATVDGGHPDADL